MIYAFLIAALSLAAEQSQPGDDDTLASIASLEIEFTGMSAQKGEVHVTLYDSADAWKEGRLFRATHVAVTGSKVTTRFDGLASGRYAMTAFHDLNDNGKLDVDATGVPVEPTAFSNNASGNGGTPKWAHASIGLTPGSNRHEIAFR